MGGDHSTHEHGPEPWASDPNVPTRQPAHCPYCGHDGAFGGLGRVGVYNATRRSHEDRYRHHCPECGYEFITITPLDSDSPRGPDGAMRLPTTWLCPECDEPNDPRAVAHQRCCARCRTGLDPEDLVPEVAQDDA